MPAPAAIAGCPAGLEYLTQIDQLLVNQQVELLECKCVCVGAWLVDSKQLLKSLCLGFFFFLPFVSLIT